MKLLLHVGYLYVDLLEQLFLYAGLLGGDDGDGLGHSDGEMFDIP
jgi:hypothetical protein